MVLMKKMFEMIAEFLKDYSRMYGKYVAA